MKTYKEEEFYDFLRSLNERFEANKPFFVVNEFYKGTPDDLCGLVDNFGTKPEKIEYEQKSKKNMGARFKDEVFTIGEFNIRANEEELIFTTPATKAVCLTKEAVEKRIAMQKASFYCELKDVDKDKILNNLSADDIDEFIAFVKEIQADLAFKKSLYSLYSQMKDVDKSAWLEVNTN